MTKDEREYLSRIAALCCRICVRLGYPDTPAEIHHQRTGVGAGNRASHTRTVGLCPEHHRGGSGIHGLGRKAFERLYGVTEVELINEVQTLLGEKQ